MSAPSKRCEVFLDAVEEGAPQCGNIAEFEYPAMGGGVMRLCTEHAQKHLPFGAREIIPPVELDGAR